MEAQQKWFYKLMGFDFVVVYKKGKENIVADALSRREEFHSIEILAFFQPIPDWVEAIRVDIEKNLALQRLMRLVREWKALGPRRIQNEILLFKEKIYLPMDSSLINQIAESK